MTTPFIDATIMKARFCFRILILLRLRYNAVCYTIDPDLILANIFSQKDKSVSIKELKRICNKVESQVPNLFLDISMDSLCFAVEHQPELFRWDGDSLAKAFDADKLFTSKFLELHMNWRIPRKMKKTFLDVLQAA